MLVTYTPHGFWQSFAALYCHQGAVSKMHETTGNVGNLVYICSGVDSFA